jgi:S-formylglutathione hydrolase FrmB
MRIAAVVVVSCCLSGSAFAEVRLGRFSSAALGHEVAYAVQLPPSYGSGSQKYPVVYALHGLFEDHLFWERRGLAALLDQLWADGKVSEFVLVTVDGDNSFFLDSPVGPYDDLLTRDLPAQVESTYRVKPGPSGRGLWGVSMGGYAALRTAFAHPSLFRAVAAHSALLLSAPPQAGGGAAGGQLRAFARVFGDPPDMARWNGADPLQLARTVSAPSVPALYFDCGTEDRYGLAEGNRALDRVLTERSIRHVFALRPGDHGYEFVRSALPSSLHFLSDALK